VYKWRFISPTHVVAASSKAIDELDEEDIQALCSSIQEYMGVMTK
jgi:hypothetical protein